MSDSFFVHFHLIATLSTTIFNSAIEMKVCKPDKAFRMLKKRKNANDWTSKNLWELYDRNLFTQIQIMSCPNWNDF